MMANPNEQIVHFDIATPRPGPQSNEEQGAGGNPVHGDVHMSGGAGGNPVQLRQAQGLPSSFNPHGRERSVTPRRSAPLWQLRSGSSSPERERAVNALRMRTQRQMSGNEHFWMDRTEEALRVQERRFEEVAASYMLETKQAFQSERAAWQQTLLAEEQQMAARGRHEAMVAQIR